MSGARTLILNGLAQSDLDMNNFRLLNLDASNLPPSGIPPTISCPPSNWLRSWNSSSLTWGYSQPAFTDLSGNLTSAQQTAITQLGTIYVGIWRATMIDKNYLPTLDQIRAPEASLSLAMQRLTNLADPVNDYDGVNKRFMDLLLQGLNSKEAVRVASTTNIPLVGLGIVDDVQLVAGDRVLVKDWSPPEGRFRNGIYVAAAGVWARSTDCDTAQEINRAYCYVLEGTINAGSAWVQIDEVVNINTDMVDFVIFNRANNITAGNGLSLTGNVMSAVGTANRITVSTGIDIASNYAGQNSITTLGTITTGTWHGTVIDPAYGGTGLANSYTIQLGGNFSVVRAGPIGSLEFDVNGATVLTLPLLGTLATLDGVETFTHKRINKRVIKITFSAQPSINSDQLDAVYITQMTGDITSMTANLTGTPTDSQELIIWFHDDNAAPRLITWGSGYAASTSLPLPTTTVQGMWLFTKFHFSIELNKWVLVLSLTNIS